jgi:L-lactate dehydrogenase complex protein LldG
MSSRESILKAIAGNKPAIVELPALPKVVTNTEEYVKINKFVTILASIGGKAIAIRDYADLKNLCHALTTAGKKVVCLVPEAGQGNTAISPLDTPVTLEPIDTAIIQASFGVAENGAVWITESQMINRLLPFIVQHLVIVLNAENLFSDMHDAYNHINIAAEGYGVFIAGPSKTADIEQSLVIGAHGARTATVYLLCHNETILSEKNKF